MARISCSSSPTLRTSVQHFDQSPFLQDFRTMASQQNQFRAPNVKFRVLIIGRANAGKTSILQRVCDTTESPKIYRLDQSGQRSEVRSRSWWHWHPQSHRPVRFNLTLQLRLDSHILVATAHLDRDDRGCSVGSMTSTMNSFLKNMMVIFSTTRADSRLVVRMS